MQIYRRIVQCSLLVIFSFFSNLWAANKPIPISLGGYCLIASALNYHHIRTASYPFDWLVTNFEGIYRTFETDFELFLREENLTIYPSEPIYVVDHATQFLFGHDFPVKKVIYPESTRSTFEDQAIGGLRYLDSFLKKISKKLTMFFGDHTSSKKSEGDV